MPLAVIPAGYGRAQSDARYLRKNALQNSAADFAQFGAAPSAAAAVNIDAASFANLAMDVRNGAAIVQLVNDGTQPYLGTTSAHAFDFLANGGRKWGIGADAAGIATLISRQATARIVGGSLNGFALRNSLNTADTFSVSDAGNATVGGTFTATGAVSSTTSLSTVTSNGVAATLTLNQISVAAWVLACQAVTGTLAFSQGGNDWLTVAITTGATRLAGPTTVTNTLAVTGATAFSKEARLQNTTVAGLTGAVTAGVGATAFVTDSVATIITGLGLTVTGGGGNKVPVYSDGANWIIG